MIRLYRESIEQLLLTLVYLHYVVGASTQRVHEGLLTWVRQPVSLPGSNIAELTSLVSDLLSVNEGLELEGLPLDLRAMIKELQSILSQDMNTSVQDGDLVTRMVKILGLPHVHNRISSRTISELREALLLPEEMVKLNSRLYDLGLSCYGCGHLFETGALATCVRDGSETTLYCTKCAKPTSTVCSKCSESVALDKKLGAAFKQGADCGRHTEEVPVNLGLVGGSLINENLAVWPTPHHPPDGGLR